jgi:hypothetical protein
MIRSGCLLLLVVASFSNAFADKPSILKMFSRDTSVAAQPINGQLSEEDGPFLILAATLNGEGSKERAKQLADEIRDQLNLPVYIYNEKFDFTKTVSFDPQTARRTRYANQYEYEAHAVLVGEYDSISHPNVEKDLDRIKRFKSMVLSRPESVAAESDRSTPVAALTNITNRLLDRAIKQGKDLGPMAQAFVTRNPILPAEYFAAPQVDSFVQALNEDVPYSLLENDAKFTVIVKTFSGAKAMIDGKNEKNFSPSADRMNYIAKQADKMVHELRKQGVEAFQFHDRERSLVTIGGFETLGHELPGGKFQYESGIREVMSKYTAFAVKPELASQVPQGSRGVAANAAALIPFDVQATPIAIPKVSKRSLYKTAFAQ